MNSGAVNIEKKPISTEATTSALGRGGRGVGGRGGGGGGGDGSCGRG